MSPDAIGALIGGAVTGGAASAVVIAKWLVPLLRVASDKAERASEKAEAASAIGAQVATEVGVGDPGPRMTDVVSIIARNTDQIIETQRLHGEQLAYHDERLVRIEEHPSFAIQMPKRRKAR